jgi:uncharacterized protein (TIGR02145 family)
MKKILLPLLLIIITFSGFAQNDTVFFMRNGMIVYQKAISEIDSMVFYRPTIDPHGSFLDIRDSTLYPTIIIGNQLWMAENLKYLPAVTTPSNGSSTDPHYYVSNYWGTDPLQAKASCSYDEYGVLYNHSAATIACPTGWHLPSKAEFDTLSLFLGGDSLSGKKLKEIGFLHWNAPNTSANNLSEFNGLPGGNRDPVQFTFFNLGNIGYFWCIDPIINGSALSKKLVFNSESFQTVSIRKDTGYSVRCIAN